jgi:hypothetical protein
MILAAHQPAYLPWLGYFNRIKRCDVFVFLDSVQFETNSFINRNLIKTAAGPLWLTVPVLHKAHIGNTMRETQIDNARDWRKKHLRSIEQSYRKAPFFEECFPRLETLYQAKFDLLADACWHHLAFWLQELRLVKRIERSSMLPVLSKKSELILDLCKHFGADNYLSGALGRGYLQLGDFAAAGIAVEFQDYVQPVTPQMHGAFAPNLSIVDAWMNLGPGIAALI